MLQELLKQWFEDAKREAWQGYAILDRSSRARDDQRTICFDKMIATVDQLPELLSEQARHFYGISEVWFERETRNLGERVGMDYFPDTTAEFLWRLLGILTKTIPDQFALRELKRARPALDDDIPFCDPQSDVPA